MTLNCGTHNQLCVPQFNFKEVLALPKTAHSAQTYKSISFTWIVWSTLYVYLWDLPKLWTTFSNISKFVLSKSFFCVKNWSNLSQKKLYVEFLTRRPTFIKKCFWKEYFPNLLETTLLHQIFIFWVKDFKFRLFAYFSICFNCAKFQQVWTTLILDIL